MQNIEMKIAIITLNGPFKKALHVSFKITLNAQLKYMIWSINSYLIDNATEHLFLVLNSQFLMCVCFFFSLFYVWPHKFDANYDPLVVWIVHHVQVAYRC